ncbi:MAG: hypothetical protein ACI9EF_003335 [Pseudohongiellaceae bacterium]|jgi:hypothetical protein
MKEVKKHHKVEEGRFHLLGLGSGARPAAISSMMSRSYVRGLALVDSVVFSSWDDDEVVEFADKALAVAVMVSSSDQGAVNEAARVHELLQAAGGVVRVETVDAEVPAVKALSATRRLEQLTALR